MKPHFFQTLLLGVFGIAPVLAVEHATPVYITFDDPNIGTYPGSATEANAIDSAGDVAGSFNDEAGGLHAFLRTSAGVFTTIDVPGSITTYVLGMNASGTIVGQSIDSQGGIHAFIRRLDGALTTFDVPGSNVTEADAINSAGEITGASDVGVFVRSPSGVTSVFKVPGAESAVAVAINSAGDVSGRYQTRDLAIGAFLRTADGTITTFEAPKAVPTQGTYATAISSNGSVLGYDYRVNGQNQQYAGFVRTPAGKFIDLLKPGTTTPLTPLAINAAGLIAGNYFSSPGVSNGFLLNLQGSFTSADVPTAETTNITCVNESGAVAGYYVDNSGQFTHAFIRLP